MIPVTPIAGRTILLDADQIAAIESNPETIIVFADRRRMLVSDPAEALVSRIGRARAARLAKVQDLRPRRDADIIAFPERAAAS
jgi:uncharacterized protein YlzI (FlbEa/FlbD family)